MTRTIWRFVGTNTNAYGDEIISYVVLFGSTRPNRERLVVRNGGRSAPVTRLCGYESHVRGIKCDGPGDSLTLVTSAYADTGFDAISNVTSAMKGHVGQDGLITWHRETERRL